MLALAGELGQGCPRCALTPDNPVHGMGVSRRVSGAYTTLLLQEEETVPDSHPGLSREGGYFCLPQL